jgi:hypothetical protein
VPKCVVRCSEDNSNWVSVIIRIYTDQMKFAAYMAFSFIIFVHIILFLFCITAYMVICFLCFSLIL